MQIDAQDPRAHQLFYPFEDACNLRAFFGYGQQPIRLGVKRFDFLVQCAVQPTPFLCVHLVAVVTAERGQVIERNGYTKVEPRFHLQSTVVEAVCDSREAWVVENTKLLDAQLLGLALELRCNTVDDASN